MKQVVNIAIGNKSFTLEVDAFQALKDYLTAFKTKSSVGVQTEETMQEIEERIAEILSSKVSSVRNVVNLNMIEEIIVQVGMPDGTSYFNRESASETQKTQANSQAYSQAYFQEAEGERKRFYRDLDSNVIGGVCSGLGYYMNIDPVLLRVVFVVLFLAGCSGLLIYIILWIVAPSAKTPAQKCEMRGWPKTAENIEKFTRRV